MWSGVVGPTFLSAIPNGRQECLPHFRASRGYYPRTGGLRLLLCEVVIRYVARARLNSGARARSGGRGRRIVDEADLG